MALLRHTSVSGAVPTLDAEGEAGKEQLRGLAPLGYWTGYARLCLGGGVLLRKGRLLEAISGDFGRPRWRRRIEAGMGDGARRGLWAWRWVREGLLVEPTRRIARR